jgi:hypothetical protein
MQKSSANQLLNKVALVAGTRLVNFQASAATYLSADLLRPQIELPGKLGKASAIYLNKISMIGTHDHIIFKNEFSLNNKQNNIFKSIFRLPRLFAKFIPSSKRDKSSGDDFDLVRPKTKKLIKVKKPKKSPIRK